MSQTCCIGIKTLAMHLFKKLWPQFGLKIRGGWAPQSPPLDPALLAKVIEGQEKKSNYYHKR